MSVAAGKVSLIRGVAAQTVVIGHDSRGRSFAHFGPQKAFQIRQGLQLESCSDEFKDRDGQGEAGPVAHEQNPVGDQALVGHQSAVEIDYTCADRCRAPFFNQPLAVIIIYDRIDREIDAGQQIFHGRFEMAGVDHYKIRKQAQIVGQIR